MKFWIFSVFRLIEDDESAEVSVPEGLKFFSNYQSIEEVSCDKLWGVELNYF